MADQRLFASQETDEADNSAVRKLPHNGKLAEVLVERHKNAALSACPGQDLLVSRVGIPISCPDGVVAQAGELEGGPTPDAGVQQKLQAA